MNPTVAIFGTLRFPPERLPEIRPHLKALIEATCKYDGCTAFDVAEDPFDPGLLRFSELWPNQESLDRHFQAPHIGAWRQAVRDCGVLERVFTAYDITNSRTI
jgi:quinol monooxygenase YgiN